MLSLELEEIFLGLFVLEEQISEIKKRRRLEPVEEEKEEVEEIPVCGGDGCAGLGSFYCLDCPGHAF